MRFEQRTGRVTGLVLRASPWREKDRLLVLLTRERGKVFALAQGAQRPQNRLGPVTQTGVQATFWLVRARDFDRVTDYRLLALPHRLRCDLPALTAFSVVAELLELAAPTEVPEADLFDEMVWFCERLEEGVLVMKWLATVQVRLLGHLGWLPYFLHCALCESPLDKEPIFFAPSAGGSVCERCQQLRAPADAQTTPLAVLQALRVLWQQPRLMETLHLRFEGWRQALLLLRAHFRYHLEAESKAWRVWRQLSEAPPAPFVRFVKG
ncbi:MAG: hypothetical protein IMHGJWDQ_000463 [Candidatus Fervidibacter sp.]